MDASFTGSVFLGMSVDGFIARLDHDLSWLTGGDDAYEAWRTFYARVGELAAVGAPTLTEPLPAVADVRAAVSADVWTDLVELMPRGVAARAIRTLRPEHAALARGERGRGAHIAPAPEGSWSRSAPAARGDRPRRRSRRRTTARCAAPPPSGDRAASTGPAPGRPGRGCPTGHRARSSR